MLQSKAVYMGRETAVGLKLILLHSSARKQHACSCSIALFLRVISDTPK